MEVEIRCEFHPELDNSFFAYAKVAGVNFIACGHSFAKAKKEMIEQLKKAKADSAIPVPGPERVVI